MPKAQLLFVLLACAAIAYPAIARPTAKAEPTVWAFTTDYKERTIIGCMEMNGSGLAAVMIAMNCRKSVMQGMSLCSQQRSLHIAPSEAACEKLHEAFDRATELLKEAPYKLDNDPWNALPR